MRLWQTMVANAIVDR